MDHEELNSYLYRYTPKEKKYLEEETDTGSRFLEEQRKEEAKKYQKLGAEAYLYESRHFMKPEDKIVISRQERFCEVLPHQHEFIELCYVWSGRSIQRIEGKEIETCKGDVCIFDTQAVHSIEAAGKEDILINILMRKEFFDTAFLSRMTRQGIVSEFLVEAVTKKRRKVHYLYFPSHQNKKIHGIMEQILLEYFTEDLGMAEVLESYLIILFTELFRVMRDESIEKNAVSSDVQILDLLAYIEENYEHCTLTDMGKRFGFHGNYLTSLLKEKTGRSFVEHVQEQKLQKARTLLENTDLSVTELIAMCGYNNMNFFYKKFKEAYGCTPAQFRKYHCHLQFDRSLSHGTGG